MRASATLSDTSGTPWWRLELAELLWTFRFRVRDGSLVPLEGSAERRLPDRLRLAIDFSTKAGLFTIGVRGLVADVTLTRACGDYEEPTFDRGHMVPNADMVRSEAAMINTYMFSNMVPQHGRFNRQIWSRLERHVRDWAMTRENIYVVTGAIFDRDGNGQVTIDELVEAVRRARDGCTGSA